MPDTAPAIPPVQRLSQMIVSLWVPQTIHAAAELGIADAIADRHLTSAAVAAQLGTHPDATARLLRALVTLGLLAERDEAFSLTELGHCLETDSPTSRRAWSRVMGGASVWASWGRLADCVRSGRKAWSLDGGSSETAHFDAMEQDHEGAAVFHRSMMELTRGAAPGIVSRLDWQGVRRVVDVGGGHGALLCAALEANPGAQGVVFDQESARAGALDLFAARGLSARATFVSGDLFESAPPPADAYLLKSVIHDWDDARSLRILAACREAMDTRARLFVVEVAAPEQRAAGTPLEWIITFSDLNMLVNTGGRERTAREYRDLLAGAALDLTREHDAGFFRVFETVRT